MCEEEMSLAEVKAHKWHSIGKGIGVGLCGLAIGFATWQTQDPKCCFAFIAVIFITLFWG